MRISRYTPSLLAHEDLEAIFVQRHKLAQNLVELVRESVVSDNKHYTLLIGPRGIGKTHLVSLVYHRVMALEDIQNDLRIAWLREEEWGVSSFLDLILRILRSLYEAYPDSQLEEKAADLYELSPQLAEKQAIQLLQEFLGARTLLLLMENLDDIFQGLGDEGQKKLRSFLQETGCCAIVATSQSLFNGVKLQTSPFYGFFRIRYLKDFSVDEAVALLRKIAQVEENQGLAEFLSSSGGRSRVQAVHHLAGGNPRIYVVFSEFLTRESLNDLIEPFMQMLDDLTPYYQARMSWLSPQQRKIVEVLCSRRYPMPVRDIAQQCFATPQTISSQLKDLRDKGYVISETYGRQAFYEVREPLMRICLAVKQVRGEPITLIVEFLRTWYGRQKLENICDRLKIDPRQTKQFQNGKFVERESNSVLEVYRRYLIQALKGESETEPDLRVLACLRILEKLEKSQNYDDFLAEVQKLKKIRGNDVDYLNEGIALGNLGRYEEALKSFDRALEINPDNEAVWNNRGIALNDLGRYEEANKSFMRVLEIDPNNDEALYHHGNVLSELDRYEDAIASYDKFIKLNSNNYIAWLQRGRVLFKLGRYEEAIASYENAIEINSKDNVVWHNLGIALVDLGRYEEAIASFDKAIKIEVTDNVAWNNRGIALGDLGRHEDALVSFENALKNDPDAVAWNNQGTALGELGCYKDALISFENALKKDPNLANAWSNRGLALSNLGDYEVALECFNKALEIDPDMDVAWFNQGITLDDLGRYEEAIVCYEQALEINPNYSAAWNSRGDALRELDYYEAAIESYSNAIAVNPESDIAWSNRGNALCELGRYEEAIASFEKALELNPSNELMQLTVAELKFYTNLSNQTLNQLGSTLDKRNVNQLSGWHFEWGLQGMFQHSQDSAFWKKWMLEVIRIFDQYQCINAITQGLSQQSKHLLSEMVSQSAAEKWRDVWQEVAGDRPEFQIPLRLLNAVVEYKKAPDDQRVFLSLAIEERKILQQLLGLPENDKHHPISSGF